MLWSTKEIADEAEGNNTKVRDSEKQEFVFDEEEESRFKEARINKGVILDIYKGALEWTK